MKSAILVYLKTSPALKASLLVFGFYPNQATHYSCLGRVVSCHFLNRIYCMSSFHPAKVRVVSTFIQLNKIKVKNIHYSNTFLWVEFFSKCICSYFSCVYIVVPTVEVKKAFCSSPSLRCISYHGVFICFFSLKWG